MTTIVTRQGKGSPLSTVEMDNNLNNLNNYKVETVNPTSSGTLLHTGVINASDSIQTPYWYGYYFLTQTPNSQTILDVTPNGTGTNSRVWLDAQNGVNRSRFDLFQTDTVSGISATNIGTGAFTPINIYTSNTLRLTISTSGAWGLNNNYGSAGQFLMSNGSSSPPTWNTVDLTTKVSKTGDTMSGPFYNDSFIQARSSGTPVIEWHRPGQSAWAQWINSNTQYFCTGLSGGGGNPVAQTMFLRQDGHLWTSAYGYLENYIAGASVNYANNSGLLGGYNYAYFASTAQAISSVQRYEDNSRLYLRNTKVNGTYTDYLFNG